MSDFAAIGMLMGLGIVATCGWFYMDKLIREQSEVIITGVLRGVPIPFSDRRLIFYRYWLLYSAALFTYQALVFVGWVMMAANARVGDVKALTYLCAFLGSMAVLVTLYEGIVGYVHLSSVLRKAQAD